MNVMADGAGPRRRAASDGEAGVESPACLAGMDRCLIAGDIDGPMAAEPDRSVAGLDDKVADSIS